VRADAAATDTEGKMSPIDYYDNDELKLLDRNRVSGETADSDQRDADDTGRDSTRGLWIVVTVFLIHYAMFYLVMELCMLRLRF
jgi:hypothetical protein